MPSPEDLKFVDIQQINPRILIDIRYATANNFVGKPVYPSGKCFLRRKVALKLDKVQQYLEAMDLGLKIWDGYRPLAVQKIFWELVPDPRYVAPPEEGSKHNRGSAVDLTLVDKQGKEVKMPTDFDDFSERAHLRYDRLPKEVIYNRTLLENTMRTHGFIPVDTEWWHFDDEEGESYPIEDLSFEEIGR